MQTVAKLIDLNRAFYTQVAESFDQTRSGNYPEGWQKLAETELFKNLPQKLTVLDLGCGNGRLFEWLTDLGKMPNYTGLDQDVSLLQIARNRYKEPSAKFIESEILNLPKYDHLFDLITVFGVMHHLPAEVNRHQLLLKLTKYLRPRGVLATSWWQYQKDPRFKDKLKESGFPENELEKGDCFIGWQKSNSIRYVHVFEDEEIESYLKKVPLLLKLNFQADGKNLPLNRYLIWQKEV